MLFSQVLALQQAVMTLKDQVAASKLSLPNVTDISEISGELEALREALRQKDISLQQMSQALITGQQAGEIVAYAMAEMGSYLSSESVAYALLLHVHL